MGYWQDSANRKLVVAVHNNDVCGVHRALQDGADPHCAEVLWTAAYNGAVGIVEALLARGADPKAHSGDGYDSLCAVATNAYTPNHLVVARLLLANGADARAQNSIAIQAAAAQKHTAMVELLAPLSDVAIALDETRQRGGDADQCALLAEVLQQQQASLQHSVLTTAVLEHNVCARVAGNKKI